MDRPAVGCLSPNARRRKPTGDCANAVLAGAGGSTSSFLVDDDVEVFVNGVSVFADNNENATRIPPIALGPLRSGDTMRVVGDGESAVLPRGISAGSGHAVLPGHGNLPSDQPEHRSRIRAGVWRGLLRPDHHRGALALTALNAIEERRRHYARAGGAFARFGSTHLIARSYRHDVPHLHLM